MAISFRKKSLEKLSSPEQLDTMIHITNRSGWIALWTIGFCLAVALAWGIYGRVATKITGFGILQNSKGLLIVKASSSGLIDEIRVNLMQWVEEGDILAIISHPEEQAAMTTAEDSLQALQDQYSRAKRDAASDLARKKLEIDLQKKEVQLSIKANQAKISRLEERVKSRIGLQKLGLITKYDVADTIETLEATRDALAQDRSQWVSLENQYTQDEKDSQAQVEDLERQIAQAKDLLAEKKAQLKKDTMITAPQNGIVVELGATQGERVSTGQEVVILEEVKGKGNTSMIALQYYPAATAKRIQVGMVTQIAPGSVKVDQYGYLLAQVIRVAEFPVTSTGLMKQLQNDELVSQVEQLGVMLEVESILLKDTETPSGYQWTSSKGPPYKLQAGTTCTTGVVVEETPPISLVIPVLKEYLLGIGDEQR